MPLCCAPNRPNARGFWSCWKSSQTWAVLLVVAAVGLTLAELVVLLLPYGNMHNKYKFTPRSEAAHSRWQVAAVGFVTVAFLVIGFGVGPGGPRHGRWFLIAPCIAYTILLITGNVMAAHEMSQRVAFEQDFAVKFNEFYCETRTARTCASMARTRATSSCSHTRTSLRRINTLQRTLRQSRPRSGSGAGRCCSSSRR